MPWGGALCGTNARTRLESGPLIWCKRQCLPKVWEREMERLSPVAQMSFMQILTTRIYLGRGDMDLFRSCSSVPKVSYWQDSVLPKPAFEVWSSLSEESIHLRSTDTSLHHICSIYNLMKPMSIHISCWHLRKHDDCQQNVGPVIHGIASNTMRLLRLNYVRNSIHVVQACRMSLAEVRQDIRVS